MSGMTHCGILESGGAGGEGEVTRRNGRTRRYCGRPGKQQRTRPMSRRSSKERYCVVDGGVRGIERSGVFELQVGVLRHVGFLETLGKVMGFEIERPPCLSPTNGCMGRVTGAIECTTAVAYVKGIP